MIASSYRYPVSRTGRKWFAGRKEYMVQALEACPDGGGGFGPRFCQVIEAVTSPGKGRQGDPWSGVPWLTIVIGSGCLDGGIAFSAESLGAEVGAGAEDALRDVLSIGAGLPASELTEPTRAFTVDLARGRMGMSAESRQSEGSEDGPAGGRLEVDPTAIRLLVLASLLTRFFHRVRSSGYVASARWDDDTAVLAIDIREISYEIVEPSLALIDFLVEDLPRHAPNEENENMVEAVCTLLASIRDGLTSTRRRLKVDHLRIVTEVAWYFLSLSRDVSIYPVYPGWTELLLRLMLREGIQMRTSSGRPRPRHTQIVELPDAVVELLEPMTRKSWVEWTEGGRSERRQQLYGATAEVLCAQADQLDQQRRVFGARADQPRLPPGASRLPPAAAFVTSFDIELDMAMWGARVDKPFSVVVPVHVLRDERSAREAEFCWLMGTVSPTPHGPPVQTLHTLRHPSVWQLLTPKTGTDVLRAQPTIIHLSGCPLFTLPDLAEDRNANLVEELADVGILVDSAEVELAHAVTVDEYLALRQSEAELFWTSNDDASASSRNRALHPSFTKDGGANRRFWMALGVPMADPAVRNRVASQITLRWIRDSAHRSRAHVTGEEFLGPDPSMEALTNGNGEYQERAPDTHAYRADVDGVAVNRYMSDDEIGLLNWLGLDIVEARCADFTEDLRHHARHLGSKDLKRVKLDRPCRLR
jgi:hypothetical protein